MDLRLPTRRQLRLAYQRDLRVFFPPDEMRALTTIRRLWDQDIYRPYCLFDGEELIGEAFLLLGRPGWALLDYLCVTAARRGQGLGPVILKLLMEAEPPGAVVFGEAEDPAFAPDPALAERRLQHFYLRNGWRDAGYDSDIYSVRYRCIYLAGHEVDQAEMIRTHRYIYELITTPKQLRRCIRIPWDPSCRTRRV